MYSGGWSCDGSVNKHIIPSTRGSFFDPLALHGPSGQTRLLLPSARTHLAPVPTLRGNPSRCLVLTDDTKLARPEQLEEVEGEIVECRPVKVIPIDNT